MKIQKTTLEYWALIAEIAGAIAIVVSVIYLGVRIRANTKVLRSQAHYNALSLAQRPFEMACRRLFQRPGRDETGTQTFLVRVPTCFRRAVSFLCGQGIRKEESVEVTRYGSRELGAERLEVNWGGDLSIR
jgi:hypothetical protein